MAKILIVDDDSEFLEMLRLLLGERENHQVILSADGKEGLAKALADPPDLAIVDVMMPEITGYEICRQLRANPSTANVPVIILTARGQPVDRQAALDAGADVYMSKPVTMTTLSEHVDEMLKKRASVKAKHTITLLSLRGGVGVTTLAVNIAATLAPAAGGETCLADLCPSSGHAALQLGLRPDPNWLSLVQGSGQTAEKIEAHLLHHKSGLYLLAAPVFPVVRKKLRQELVRDTLESLRQRFAFVVVDTPSVLDEATIATLETATAVILVLTPEPSSIQTTIGTLRALKQWAAKIRVVINQVTPGPQVSIATVERALKRSPTSAIPYDPAQARALAQGAPLALYNPNSPLAQAVRGLTKGLSL